jgi:hypothetical protein
VLERGVPASAFRFFVGHHAQLSVSDGAWCAAACSRNLILRQHPASLPTPLWHELLDLCGGEYAQISAAVRERPNTRPFGSGAPVHPARIGRARESGPRCASRRSTQRSTRLFRGWRAQVRAENGGGDQRGAS